MVRRTCPEDRRGAFAQLTTAGRELMDRAVPEHIAHVDEVLSELYTAEEEATLEALLRRLHDRVVGEHAGCGLAEDDGLCPDAG